MSNSENVGESKHEPRHAARQDPAISARIIKLGLAMIAGVLAISGGMLISRGEDSNVFAESSSTTATTVVSTTSTTLASTTTTPTTSTTAAPVSTAAVPSTAWQIVGWNGKSIPRGTSNDTVTSIKARLNQLHFDVGTLNSKFDTNLYHAVMAFQKLNGLTRTGSLDVATINALATAVDPAPLSPEVGATRVEVHIPSQTFRYWVDGKLVRVMSVSTGNNRSYCDNGSCGVAVTPKGIHMTYRRIKGVRKAQLGTLYDPVYFKGGFALHGSPSVPAGPASHGCVRVPMVSSRWVYDNIPDGVPVIVMDSDKLNAKYIVEPASAPIPVFS